MREPGFSEGENAHGPDKGRQRMPIGRNEIKGIVHQYFFYRSNLIFWMVMGTKLKPKIFEFGAFGDPSDQNKLYHTPLLSNI